MQTQVMSASPLNQALAVNLAYHMERKGLKQMALAKKCGVAQTTISNYLNPERRKLGKDGKAGSAKLTEVEMLAAALDVEPWELLRPMDGRQREVYEKIEAAYKALSAAPATSIHQPAAKRQANKVDEPVI
ncbi:helix-turn-helix domain-containing protein [Comamonas sp.]|uniref:helix-turn-helix domain-containing protein n=1 Tax=Comamonas sp. TaxID=34028 RepID=UPI003A939C61